MLREVHARAIKLYPGAITHHKRERPAC